MHPVAIQRSREPLPRHDWGPLEGSTAPSPAGTRPAVQAETDDVAGATRRSQTLPKSAATKATAAPVANAA